MLRVAILTALAAVLGGSQDFSNISIVKVLTGYRFANSPVWSREGHWLFSDAPANHVLLATPGLKPEVFLDSVEGASGIAFDAQGRVYVCEGRGRRVVRVDKKKQVEPLAESFEGKRLNAPHDIAVRKDGNVYFTDPAFGYQQDHRELDFYGVYRVTPKGDLGLVAKSPSRPNGVALSPNGRTLYVSDSDKRAVRAYDLDKAGAASNERRFVGGIEGVPSGMCVDEKGNLYVTARNIGVYTAEGKRLQEIPFGTPAFSCGFGDPDLQSLYIASGPSVYRIRLNVKGAVQY
jgi:gluconolactonase